MLNLNFLNFILYLPRIPISRLSIGFVFIQLIFNASAYSAETHLSKTLTFEEAAWFERRVGIGAPFTRVENLIGKTRKQAIDQIIDELESYKDDFLWPEWVDDFPPIGF